MDYVNVSQCFGFNNLSFVLIWIYKLQLFNKHKKNKEKICYMRIKNERLKRVKIKMLNQQRRKRDPS